MPATKKVFISYASERDNPGHAVQVKGLADSLCRDDIDCTIDQYLPPKGPGDGWQLWMEKEIEQADFVLLVCTQTYLRRVRKEEEPGTGLGATWEAAIIYQYLYESQLKNHKFIPVMFRPADKEFIPKPLGSVNRYLLDKQQGYDDLYRHITDQPCVVRPRPEGRRTLPAASPTPLFAPAGTAKPPSNLPPRNHKFVGRETELGEIHKRLNEKGKIGVTQQTAAHGLGGVGKTSVALEYAWKHLDDYRGGLFVLLCDRDYIVPEIVNLAVPLAIEESETPEETANHVKQRLESGRPALLILDNVRDARQFNDPEWSRFLPAGNCRRLITTRAPTLGPDVTMYPIERLPTDKGIELIAQFREDAAAEGNRDIVGGIVDWFDGLAVGLTVVGVYMSLHPHLTWPAYKESLDNKGLGTVRQSRDIIDHTAGGLPERYERRIDAVFDETLDALDPPHRRALEYAALLPEDTVLAHWLTWLLENDGTVELPETPGYESAPAAAVVSTLTTLRLLRPLEGEQDTLSLHRVLHRHLEERLAENPDHVNALLDRLVELAELRGKASHAAITDKSRRPELTPLLRLTDVFLDHQRPQAAASLANWLHIPLHGLARFQEDRTSLHRFIESGACNVEADDPQEAATLLSNLALTMKDVGDLPEARRYMERAIEIDQKHLDRDHPTLAIRYSNLATILQDLGDFPEACRYMERAIEIDQKHFDPDHPKLAVRFSNLALILRDLGDLSEARRYMQRAIGIWEQHFDPDHPKLAVSYSNLAMILKDLGNLPEARSYTERAIKIDEKHFDPDHPKRAVRYSNLAAIVADLGDLPEARRYIERAIEIFEKHLGPDHPNLAVSYNNLAHIELASARKTQACNLWRRAYRIATRHFDPDHPHVRDLTSKLETHCGGADDDA